MTTFDVKEGQLPEFEVKLNVVSQTGFNMFNVLMVTNNQCI
jgi:hypothetical protein